MELLTLKFGAIPQKKKDVLWLAPTLIDSGALLLQSLLIDNQEKKRRSTYSTTAFLAFALSYSNYTTCY